MPITAVASLPTAAPSEAALIPSTIRTLFASSSGTTLSRLFFDASRATIASFNVPFAAASLTRSTPITASRPRTPSPASPSTFFHATLFAASTDAPSDRRAALGRSGIGRVILFAAAFRGDLVDERHQAIGLFRRDAGQLEEVLALEVDDVVQRFVAARLEHSHRRRRQPLDVGELDVRGFLARLGLLLVGERLEERYAAAALEPFTARVEVDLPLGQLRREAHVLPVSADRERELVLVHDRLDGLGGRIAEHARDLRRRERELGEALRIRRPRNDIDALAAEVLHEGLHRRAPG